MGGEFSQIDVRKSHEEIGVPLEYVSISTTLKKAFVHCARSCLYAESDENDAAYFIVYQLEVLIQALAQLEAYIERKVSQVRAVEKRLSGRSNYNIFGSR